MTRALQISVDDEDKYEEDDSNQVLQSVSSEECCMVSDPTTEVDVVMVHRTSA